jgi:hypothetical protein
MSHHLHVDTSPARGYSNGMPKAAASPTGAKMGRPKGANFLTAVHYLRRGHTVGALLLLGIPRRTIYRARKYVELNKKSPGRAVP